MSDTTATIKHSAKRFFSGTLLSRISGLLRDMSMAYFFGAGASVAAFLLAFRLAHLMRRLFGEGALQSAFVPEFEAMRLVDEKKAFGFFCSLTVAISLILLLLIIFFGLILMGILIKADISTANYEVIYLTLLMLPSLLFICLYGINTSLLQCQRFYFISSVAPVAFNLTWIVSVVILKDLSPQQAMPYLATGVIAACFFQWIWTVPKTFSFIKKAGIDCIWKASFSYFGQVTKLIRPLCLGMIGVAATQINSLVDSLFARYAELEGPAILWYAMRLQQLPLALFGIAIAGAILPPLSRAIKAADPVRYQHFLTYGLLTTVAFMLPITGMIFCMGDTAINLIYGRGDFTNQAIQQTTICLWAYGLGLIPSALVLILAPAYFAKNNYSLPALTSSLMMLLNLLLNALFIFFLSWGAFSVALATSISSWINFLILYKNMDEKIFDKTTAFFSLKLFISTLSASFTVILSRYFSTEIFFNVNGVFSWTRSVPNQFFNLLYQLTLFTIVWLLISLFLKTSFNKLFFLKDISKVDKSVLNIK